MAWNVYLAGEIHSDWRDQIAAGAQKAGLDVEFSSPVTDHGASDDVGVSILGDESEAFWKDHKGAGVNAIRTGPCGISGCAMRWAAAVMISATPALLSAPSNVAPDAVTMSWPI